MGQSNRGKTIVCAWKENVSGLFSLHGFSRVSLS